MITFLMEMLEFSNFGRMTTSAIMFKSRDKILLMTSYQKLRITLIPRRPGVTNSADIIKIEIMFIKATFKDSIKFKRIKKMYKNVVFVCISQYNKNY